MCREEAANQAASSEGATKGNPISWPTHAYATKSKTESIFLPPPLHIWAQIFLTLAQSSICLGEGQSHRFPCCIPRTLHTTLTDTYTPHFQTVCIEMRTAWIAIVTWIFCISKNWIRSIILALLFSCSLNTQNNYVYACKPSGFWLYLFTLSHVYVTYARRFHSMSASLRPGPLGPQTKAGILHTKFQAGLNRIFLCKKMHSRVRSGSFLSFLDSIFTSFICYNIFHTDSLYVLYWMCAAGFFPLLKQVPHLRSSRRQLENILRSWRGRSQVQLQATQSL